MPGYKDIQGSFGGPHISDNGYLHSNESTDNGRYRSQYESAHCPHLWEVLFNSALRLIV